MIAGIDLEAKGIGGIVCHAFPLLLFVFIVLCFFLSGTAGLRQRPRAREQHREPGTTKEVRDDVDHMSDTRIPCCLNDQDPRQPPPQVEAPRHARPVLDAGVV